MKPSEIRRQFVVFLILAGILVLILTVLQFAEPLLKTYVKDFFPAQQQTSQQTTDTPPQTIQPTASPQQPIQTTATPLQTGQPIKKDNEMGDTAEMLFLNIINIINLIIWMGLIIAVVRLINTLISGTLLRNTGNAELTILIRNVLSITIYVFAFVTMVKSYFKTDLTTFFAGSTIIGVVIGLALQDTLGNLFAGLALQADQPFQLGDVINIPNKGVGVVESVTWRGVKIRTFQNKIIVISNAVLGKEAIEVAPRDNLNARLIYFSSLYADSPAKTIQAVRDVVRQAENVSPKMRPIVRIRNLGESGLEWEVKYWLEDYAKYNETDALVRQRIWYVFQREKLEFPYQTRTIHVETKTQDHIFEESNDDLFDRLSNVPLFAPLNDDETLKLARSCLVRVFAPGEAIVRKGKEGGSMFVVHRGSVKIQLIENNVARTIANLSEGDIFGEMGLFTGEPRSADVVATEETEVLEIHHISVKPLFDDNPDLVEALSKTIAKRRMELNKKSEDNKEIEEMESTGIFNSIKKFFGIN